MQKVEFSMSLLFFWIKGKVQVDNRFVKLNIPNVVLGVVPAGSGKQSIPLKNISGSILSSSLQIKPLLIGLLISFFGLGMLGDNFFVAFIMLAIGLTMASNGILTTLTIEKSGSNYTISVPFYEKAKLIILDNQLDEALAADTDKTDLNQFFDKKGPTPSA